MHLVIERCDEERREWELIAVTEASGDRAAAAAVEQLGDAAGLFRVWPMGKPVEHAEQYELGIDGIAVQVDVAER